MEDLFINWWCWMLLNIDRVLQLLAEGKSIEKIAEMSSCETVDVVKIINDARELLLKYEKPLAKKKLIIKKKSTEPEAPTTVKEVNSIREILQGADLSVIPVKSSITIYATGLFNEKTNRSGIGIVLFDKENRQVGKLSDYIGKKSDLVCEAMAVIRAIRLAKHIEASDVRLRISSETLMRYIEGKSRDRLPELGKYLEQIKELSEKLNLKFEVITKAQNDKAIFLAQKATEKAFKHGR